LFLWAGTTGNKKLAGGKKRMNLNKADIILLKNGTGLDDEAIELGGGTIYYHAAGIVNTDGTLIEMTGNGVAKNNIGTEYLGKTAFDVFRLIAPMPFSVIQGIADYAETELSRKVPYNWGAIIGEGFKSILGWVGIKMTANPFNAKSDFDCSEFWSDAYLSQDINLCPLIADESLVAPGDLGKSLLLKKVYAVGNKGNIVAC
jgi:hypothetical protein